MDVILHIGAHRTASTSFQTYMRAHNERLSGQAIGFWGPWRTRGGLFHGVVERPENPAQIRRAVGRVQINLQNTGKAGIGALIISDENLIGTPRANLRAGRLYPQIGERMARLHAAVSPIRRIVLTIRSPEAWWASALAYLVPRGLNLPSPQALDKIAFSPRSWRHVITDLACACPDAQIVVVPFERFGGAPDEMLKRMTGALFAPAAKPGEYWVNRSPDLAQLRNLIAERGLTQDTLPQGDGRWQPFTAGQVSHLREAYSDDLFWLQAGADGLAQLTRDSMPKSTRNTGAFGQTDRGQDHDSHARRLAQTR